MAASAGTASTRPSGPPLGARWRQASYGVRFAVLLVVTLAALAVAGPVEEVLRRLTQRAVVEAVPLLGLHAQPASDGIVTFHRGDRRYAYRIVAECAALNTVALYSAAIFAYRLDLRRRLVGFLAGSFALLGLNLLRLVLLAEIGVHRPAWFSPAHDVGWPLFQIAGVLVMTLCWLRWAARPTTTSRGARGARLPSRRTNQVLAAFAAFLGASLALSAHHLYETLTFLPLTQVGYLVWGGRVSFLHLDPGPRAVGRFLALAVAVLFVILTHRRGRAALPALRLAGLVTITHAAGSMVEGVLSVATAPPRGGLAAPPQDWGALVVTAEMAIVTLLMLRTANRRRPMLR